MGKVLLEEQSLIDIANSIRNKIGSAETMKPSEMASNIDAIESGGGDLSEYFVETITNGSNNTPGFASVVKKLPKLKNTGTSCEYMFFKFQGTSLDLSEIDTFEVKTMERMFQMCVNLTSLDLSTFDTSTVTDMSYMFRDCQSLTELDLSNFNTESVLDMSNLFYDCKKLKKIDLSSFDTSKVTTMNSMFGSCDVLENLDIKHFITNQVTDMSNLFSYCKKLTSLDLSNFNTSNVTKMQYMFNNCKNLTHLDIRNFDFTKVTSYTSMFGSDANFGVPDDCLIIVKDDIAKTWITSKFSRLTNVKTVAEHESGV